MRLYKISDLKNMNKDSLIIIIKNLQSMNKILLNLKEEKNGRGKDKN
jgi:hypothetical protein